MNKKILVLIVGIVGVLVSGCVVAPVGGGGCDRNPYHHGGSYDILGCWHR